MIGPRERPHRARRVAIAAAACGLVLVSGGCAINPATGRPQVALISESREIAMGREAHQQVLRSMSVYEDPQLAQYVDSVGKRLAAVSERPELDWTFTVVDDPSVNAFALPGGYIYVTRGILTHMTSEAQAAAVLGHEIGHVTGRHSVEQISKAQIANVGLMVGSILSPAVAQMSGLAQTGAQLLFLKFGRDHERQADDLGLRYMTRLGYDPQETVEMFRVLEAQSTAETRGRLPDWLSTHPNPGSRVARMREAIAEQVPGDAPGETGQERFLDVLDGTAFGEDPREGYFVGEAFYHPGLRFQMRVPAGWRALNMKQAVVAVSPEEDAAIVLGLTPADSAQRAARQFAAEQTVRTGPADATQINGLPAVLSRFQAQTRGGVIEGVSSFVEYDGRVYQLLAYAGGRQYETYRPALEQAVGSFAPLRDPERLNIQPQRIEIVRVPTAMSVDEFQQRYPSTVSLDTVRLINHLGEGESLQANRRYKRVVGGASARASG